MKKIKAIGVLALCAMGLVLFTRACGQTAFTIDVKARCQTMEGFGATATGTWIPEAVGLYAQPSFAQIIGDDLGASIIRLALPPAIQPNEDPDPAQLDLASFDFAAFSPPANFIKNVYLAHPDLKVMLTVWSPPAWMKDNNTTINGGHLRADRRAHFAKFCAAACLGFEQTYGVPVYALSIQNEPVFVEPYDSCVYSPDEMRDTVKAVRIAFTRWSVHAKIMAPEDVADAARYPTFAKSFETDPAALQALDIMNIHGEPMDGSGQSAGPWETLRNKLKPLKKPLWMTETSGEEATWLGAGSGGHGALSLARSIHNAVVFGDCAAWVYWAITDPSPDEFSLMSLNQPTPKYSALKQYSKFIRPGSVRIAVTPTSSTILGSAYLDEDNGKLTVVFINMNATDTPITGTLVSLPTPIAAFQTVRSSSTENCLQLAATPVVGERISLTLKGQSVTTLVGYFTLDGKGAEVESK